MLAKADASFAENKSALLPPTISATPESNNTPSGTRRFLARCLSQHGLYHLSQYLSSVVSVYLFCGLLLFESSHPVLQTEFSTGRRST